MDKLLRRSVIYVLASIAVFAGAAVFYERILNSVTVDHYFPQTNLGYWFWISDLAAPILGAMVIGTIADMKGRNVAISLSVANLSGSFICAAMTLASIGSGNPTIVGQILLIAFHSTFAIASSSMLASAIIYMFESAPLSSRGLYVGIGVATQGIGSIVGATAYAGLAACLGCMKSIGWSGVFLLAGAILVPMAVLTWKPEESEDHEGYQAPTKQVAFLGFLLLLLVNFAAIAVTSLGNWLGRNGDGGFAISALGLFAVAALGIFAGMFSDRSGRKLAMLAPALFLVAVPACGLLTDALRNFAVSVVFVAGVLAHGFLRPAVFTALVEALPHQARGRWYLGLTALSNAMLVYYQGYKSRDLVRGDLINWELIIIAGCCAIAVFPNIVQKKKTAETRA